MSDINEVVGNEFFSPVTNVVHPEVVGNGWQEIWRLLGAFGNKWGRTLFVSFW